MQFAPTLVTERGPPRALSRVGVGAEGVRSLPLDNDKSRGPRGGRCLMFFAIKLGSCLSGHVEPCDILGSVRPA